MKTQCQAAVGTVVKALELKGAKLYHEDKTIAFPGVRIELPYQTIFALIRRSGHKEKLSVKKLNHATLITGQKNRLSKI